MIEKPNMYARENPEKISRLNATLASKKENETLA